ncbi:MAG: T9SS type A sorting domain-containing protein [Candidatus Cloacimonetes bacterium]|nr:T9SS type A sorting domain-containing protein [Candidatus Cloacimonadota bacterium]
MRLLIACVLVASFVSAFATPLTQSLPLPPGAYAGEQAPTYVAPEETTPQPEAHPQPLDREEWYIAEEWPLDVLLHAGGHVGLRWQNSIASLVQSADGLTYASDQAIQRAPAWLRTDLANVLCQLSSVDQNTWAGIINDADNPLVDEIAFCVAHTSTEFFGSEWSFPELFVQNAELLYEIDTALDYVEIIDTGAWPDDDYWSTTRYTRLNEDGEVEQIDVPRDIYYWCLVHPKITDDIPTYIDPDVIENNNTHVNNIDADGEFWREWFWTHADDNYPLLSDMLDGVQYMWARDGSTDNAIMAVQQWVNDSMSFTSNNERPHQPVRIYRKHIGRCGEHADITAAAARTALIPCTSILTISNDHTWNEFWESEWVAWEPVNGYINNPLVYENGWGRVLGTAFDIRSDGFLTSVTERYSEDVGTLEIHVDDWFDRPIDGARIILAIMDGSLRSDMVGFTDNEGICVFIVGDARDYYMHVSTPLGHYPVDEDEYALLVQNMPPGGEYTFLAPIAGDMPWPEYNPVNEPDDDTDDWKFIVQYETVGQVVSGIVTWDDIDETGTRPLFYKHAGEGGSVNWFVGPGDSYLFYQLPMLFDSFHTQYQSTSGEDVFNIPVGQTWAAWLDNGCAIANPQHVTGTLQLWHWGESATGGDEAPFTAPRLLGNRPNPFNPSTSIAFSLTEPAHTTLCVYDVRGRFVAQLVDEPRDAGEHTVTWEAEGCASGVYLLRMEAGGTSHTQRMLLLK